MSADRRSLARRTRAVVDAEQVHGLDDSYDRQEYLAGGRDTEWEDAQRRCSNCGTGDVRAAGRCRSCYQYHYRNGVERPERLWRRAARPPM